MKIYLLKQEQLAMQKQKSHTLCFRFTEDIDRFQAWKIEPEEKSKKQEMPNPSSVNE